ncbi:hypothetical protein MFLAVUS_001560 [Mucor flavus]|uniref:Uncharacterized protein n=1 Tax=Mucor flavus TaxID=439312 RepID=A0ABP9YMT8_9FUNG
MRTTKWDFNTFKDTFRNKNESSLDKIYLDCLNDVMIDSKGISCNVAENINKLLNEKVMPSTVVHNYYNSGHVVNASSATIDRRSIKKQKVFYESHSRKKEKEEDENWLTILEDCETQKYLHKYRKAPKLDLLNAEVTHGLTKKVKKITNVILKKSSITHSEAVYNDRFVFGLTGVLLDEFDNHEMSPFFVPGEEELVAMTTRIKKLKLKVDYRMIYKADGVVCSENDLDLVLLETAGAFKKNDPSKIAFDNSKAVGASRS